MDPITCRDPVTACSEGIYLSLFSLFDSDSLPLPVLRGLPCSPYTIYGSMVEKLIEMDFDETVIETRSEWQPIKIVHSPRLGNVLIANNDVGECA